jgi:hypothetical protein
MSRFSELLALWCCKQATFFFFPCRKCFATLLLKSGKNSFGKQNKLMNSPFDDSAISRMKIKNSSAFFKQQ